MARLAGSDVDLVIPGRFYVLYARHDAPNVLLEAGEMRDDLNIQFTRAVNPINADSRGGDAGHAIEQQYLGEMGQVSLDLTRFSTTFTDYVATACGINAVQGTILDCEIGSLMMRDHSMRMLFYPLRNPTRARNFPCVTVERPHIIGGGTKLERCRLECTVHRAPCDHPKENVLYDQDFTGLPQLPVCTPAA